MDEYFWEKYDEHVESLKVSRKIRRTKWIFEIFWKNDEEQFGSLNIDEIKPNDIEQEEWKIVRYGEKKGKFMVELVESEGNKWVLYGIF